MSTRVAFVEKQLAAWDNVESATHFCRNWYSTRPMIRQEALAALEKWQRSEMILSGSEQKDSIELTVVSATGLPKSNFRTSNAWVKMVHYGPNQFGGYLRTFDLKTDVSKATQHPVWNKKFLLEISSQTKLLDFELYDRVAGIDTQLCKYRIFCSFVPGVEASLANRSLLYGIDGESAPQ